MREKDSYPSIFEPGYEGHLTTYYEDATPWWPAGDLPEGRQPNILFLVLDDMGYADLGCYGSEIRTPNIDRLAARGLRYTNFHTTAICSPTRASLLTGRNPHAVGVGTVVEMSDGSSGFPGYRSKISPNAATVAEILRTRDYATYACGKWHVMPLSEATATGPFGAWPTQRGFDRWYGFHGGLSDQWHPELFADNHAVETPAREGYHLDVDLIDKSIGFLREHQAGKPDQPFFLYHALAAAHWPHHAPNDVIDSYRGAYDEGWDVIRQRRFERQKEIGVIPADAGLPPSNEGVQVWDELTVDEQRVFARMQEVYAGYVEHTDAQIGRLTDHLDESGLLDDTVIVLISDNGSSPEGGQTGAINARKVLEWEPDTIEQMLEKLDELGSETTFPHYPHGWAQVSNTPLKWYKKNVHGGGVRDPLIVSWPAGIKARDEIREQFHFVADVVPTVLDLCGIEAPRMLDGREQIPMQGVSMAYSFADADAPSRKERQYFEQVGNRGMWIDGWKAVARHLEGTPFDHDVWELYHLAEDFSECNDLAATHPEKLEELLDEWWIDAEANQVFPLDDRMNTRKAMAVAKNSRPVRVYRPGMARVDRFSVPDFTDRDYQIVAHARLRSPADEGVLLSVGSGFSGMVLYVRESRLVLEYVYDREDRFLLRSPEPLAVGSLAEMAFTFTVTGDRAGVGRLLVNGAEVVSSAIPRVWPTPGLTAGLVCGRDVGSRVGSAYELPFAFTGELDRVEVALEKRSKEIPPERAKRYAMLDE